MYRVFIRTIILIGLLLPVTVNSYELTTHEYLSEQAADASDLKQTDLLSKFGFDYNTEFPVEFAKDQWVNLRIRDIIGMGARLEDNLGTEDGGLISTLRPLRHFYDPQLSESEGYDYGFIGEVDASPNWALEDKEDSGPLIGLGDIQKYSYKEAMHYKYMALTDPDPEERRRYWGKVFRSLGQVIHHLQDMAQPQHVRNDYHLYIENPVGIPVGDILCEEGPNGDCLFLEPSFYEHRTEELVRNLSDAEDLTDYGQNPKKKPALEEVFPTTGYSLGCTGSIGKPRHFWSNDGKGLAEFVSENFVTVESNFRASSGDPGTLTVDDILTGDGLLPDPEHPLPNGDFKWLNLEAVPSETVFGEQLNITGVVPFIGGYMDDKCNSTVQQNHRMSTLSIFDEHLAKKGKEPLFTLNSFNYEARYQHLIPRAVAYSKELLNFFFRSEMSFDIEVRTVDDDRGNIKIRFRGGPIEHRGYVSVYYEDNNGILHMLDENEYARFGGGKGSIYLRDWLPDLGYKYNVWAVFRGSVGDEGYSAWKNSEDNYAGVTVAKLEWESQRPPSVPCGETVKANGRSGTYNFSMSLGTDIGEALLTFEPYTIPDGVVVRYSDGSLIYSSEGPTAEFVAHTFNVTNPNRVEKIVNITVQGNSDTDTKWDFALYCPGGFTRI